MRESTSLILVLIVLGVTGVVNGQGISSAIDSLPEAPSYAKASVGSLESVGTATSDVPAIISTQVPRASHFRWRTALQESFYLLAIQHSVRMSQAKTRREMAGAFFRNYTEFIAGVHGWGDGDGFLANYVGHPMQGSISGYIAVQNDPSAIHVRFGGTRQYWNSRLRAMAWAAAYSTQFEIGPLSEATIGNVGKAKGTGGWSDFIITPTGGFGLILAEDALDRFLISRWEGSASASRKRFYRMLLNPSRSFANVLRKKVPWHRDTRPLRSDSEFFDTYGPFHPSRSDNQGENTP